MSFMYAAIGMVSSALIGGIASNSAANKQVGAANRATDLQRSIFDTTYGQGAPYRDAGAAATARLRELLGIGDNISAPGFGSMTQQFTGADFIANKDPSYEFMQQQGLNALQNSLSAGNGIMSGPAGKALIEFNQNYAKTGYQNAFDRWMTGQNAIYSRLGNLSSLGENAAVNAGNTGATFANGMAGTITGAGNAGAAGIMGGANAFTGAINNGVGWYQLNTLADRLKRNPEPNSGYGSYTGAGLGTSSAQDPYFDNSGSVF